MFMPASRQHLERRAQLFAELAASDTTSGGTQQRAAAEDRCVVHDEREPVVAAVDVDGAEPDASPARASCSSISSDDRVARLGAVRVRPPPLDARRARTRSLDRRRASPSSDTSSGAVASPTRRRTAAGRAPGDRRAWPARVTVPPGPMHSRVDGGRDDARAGAARNELDRPPRPDRRGPRRPAVHAPEQRRADPPQVLVADQPALPARPRRCRPASTGIERREPDAQLVLGLRAGRSSHSCSTNMLSLCSRCAPFSQTSAIVASPRRRSSHGPSPGSGKRQRNHQSRPSSASRVGDAPRPRAVRAQRAGRGARHVGRDPRALGVASSRPDPSRRPDRSTRTPNASAASTSRFMRPFAPGPGRPPRSMPTTSGYACSKYFVVSSKSRCRAPGVENE